MSQTLHPLIAARLDARIAKAIEAVESGKIEVFDGVDVALVPSDSDPGLTHTVVLVDDETATCTCRAGRNGVVCWHQLAARQVIADRVSS